MNQLIVRPIDDDRYSAISQMLYIRSLKDYNPALYEREVINFKIRHYAKGFASITQAFCNMARAMDEAIENFAANLGRQLRRGLMDNKDG
ncbi:MAG: hypothetical protein ACPHVJ_03060 [Psychrobacter sp.]